MKSHPLVIILMATFNGARYLREQLDSIAKQTHQNWRLIVSDDGSVDETFAILKAFQADFPGGQVIIQSGPQKGSAENFMSMLMDESIKADYYAFSDQDDVWMPSKIEVAIDKIVADQKNNLPFIYCSRTTYVDETLKECGASPLFVFPRTFRNALVQSIAGGNTMVFNHAAKILCHQEKIPSVVVHDWWLYMIVSGVGGVVEYDPKALILYRQHKDALIGGSHKLSDRIKNILRIFKGEYRKVISINVHALDQVQHLFTHENQEVYKLFKTMREVNLKNRIRLMIASGIYRQSARGTLSLVLAVVLKRI
jgi:glycosyltransferase involved in cell wall biosynthesis